LSVASQSVAENHPVSGGWPGTGLSVGLAGMVLLAFPAVAVTSACSRS
jgi:hypothetical protein